MKLLLTLLIVGLGTLPTYAQQRLGLRPYLGIHASGDAEMYYLGPSFQVGSDYRFTERWGLSAYVHSYRNRVDEEDDYHYEKGKFNCFTGALLLEFHAGRQMSRGMFFAGGVAVQRVKDVFDASWGAHWNDERTGPIPAIRFGYAFPLRKTHCITAEINATGPYQERYGYSGSTELITQLSLGTRLIW